ncbi:MAG TPA: hypothetical protein PLK38_10110, partial [Methanoregulaceae archaeon]|nr:hypothetical protein [Methanoregulaceae archaeon]
YAVRAKVVKLFEPRSKKMHQTGLLGDESGVARFVTWSSRAPPTLEQGKTYLIDDLYASEYNDKINADLTNSTVEEINDDIKVAPAPGIMLIGAVTRVLSAGIVYRCAAKGCRKAVDIGPGGYMCPVHGILEDARVDLRARVVLDDGVQATTVFIPAAVLEKLTWISLAGAVDLAASTKVGGNFLVENKLRDSLFGKYLKVFVSPMSGQYYCQDAEVLHSFSDLEGVDTRASWELKEPPEWIPTEATRSFIAEMLQVKEILKEGPEKTSPTYAVLPSGERAARFVWAGVLVDVNRFNDSLTCNINDPTGILKLRVHRQYQAKAFQTLQNIKAPALIAVAGKLSLYKPPDGDKTYVSLV